MSEKNTLRNLDRVAAETAQEIVRQAGSDVENLVQKTMGVLQENGVYACLLFLYSRSEREEKQARAIREQLLQMLGHELLRPLQLGLSGSASTWKWENVSKQLLEERRVFDDLDKLLLIKELYEQTLIYSRYGAKAAKECAELQASSS